jgi:hypothetical protein
MVTANARLAIWEGDAVFSRLPGLVVAAVAIVACGGGHSGPPAFRSAADLQRALDAHGVGCAGFEAAKPGEKQKYADQQAYCQIQGENAVLYVFKSVQDLRSWVTYGVKKGCSFGLSGVTFVRGPNWVVQPETPAVSQSIHARLGGTVEVHPC